MFNTIKEFLESGEYEIKFEWINKQTYGLIDREKQIIYLNFYLLIIETLVHEYLHYSSGSDNEKFIEKKTDKVVDRMTVKEIKKLLKIAMDNSK